MNAYDLKEEIHSYAYRETPANEGEFMAAEK